MFQFTTVDEKSFAYGIDARSAENQIREGFVRDLVNADIIEGRIRKRKGYSSYAGNVPVRVNSVRYENPNIIHFSLDSSIDLSRVDSTPITVYGRTGLSGTVNPFSTVAGLRYYPSWTTSLRKTILANTTGVTNIPVNEHTINSTNMFVGLAESTGTDLSGTIIDITSIGIDSSSYNISLSYTNGTNTNKSIFAYYLQRESSPGAVYISTGALTPNSTNTITIPPATHNLNNYLIIPELHVLVGSIWEKTLPDSFVINNGTVTCDIVVGSGTGIPTQYKLILSIVSSVQTTNFSLNGGSDSFTIPDVGSPFLFTGMYINTINGLELVQGNEIHYDDVTKGVTISYTNNNTPLSGVFYYAYGEVRTNQITVVEQGSPNLTNGTDTSPQLSIWGLDHAIIYGSDKQVERRGWVNHIDSYKSPQTNHLICGLGGNLFAALGKDEINSTLSPSLPTYYTSLQSRVASTIDIGPAFVDTSSPANRTRGIIKFDSGGLNWATVTSAIYISSTNRVRYTLSVPNLSYSGTPISVSGGLEDYLTIKNMSHSYLEGTFKIKVVTYDTGNDTITIDVENGNIDSSDYDDSGCIGLAGVFTDQITFSSVNDFIEEDLLLSSSWGLELELVVKTTSSLTSLVQNVYEFKNLPSGLLIAGSRTSDTIFLQNNLGVKTVDYLVVGDVLTTNLVSYPVTVTSVDPDNNSITVDNEITWYDDAANNIYFSVYKRWIPREMPLKDSGDSLINDKIPRYFSNNSYGNQPFLRSTMVQNTMYLTNGDDEVYKYDGLNTYRAGIIPWQPGLFTLLETVVTGGIPLVHAVADDGGSGDVLELVGGRIKIDAQQAAYFSDGDKVIIRDGTLSPSKDYYLTIRGREEESSGSHFFFSFLEPLPFSTLGSGATVQMIKTYFARYCFRLNLKDRNGVIVASAVTGSLDFVVLLALTNTDQQKVHLRLTGLPAWDHYDYQDGNIELKIYRTLWSSTDLGEVPVFYEVSTKTLPFTGPDGYIDFIDTLGNNSLQEVDGVASVLSPTTIPAAWDEPVRAKYITSAGNRLVLANITDWPTLAISYLTSGKVVNTTFNGQKFFFKRDTNDSSLDTDMVNRATYELRSSGGVTISSFSSTTGGFTITVPSPGRAPVIGDWVYIYFASSLSHPLDFCGWWQISSVSGSGPYTCTIKSSKTYVSPTHTHTALFATTAKDIPVNISTDYNMQMYNGDVVNVDIPSLGILRRIGMAINATMRMTDTTISGQSSFVPWLVARSESDTFGQLIVKQPRAELVLPSVTITNSTSIPIYVNGSKVSNGGSVDGLVSRYPSRILASYNNYPEIFDNPFTINTDLSASAIDVNSSDGQEITGIIPFFGESAFGAALQGGVLVVFKQNSIYLVNLDMKAEGKNAVERLETQGLGCTAPYSIAPTKDGIAFANDSGIYVLRRNQRIEYLGRFMERNWQNKVDKNYLDIVQGHHYNVGRQYKLSIPLSAESSSSYAENSEVYVYNHTNEGTEEPGGWGRYTNHPATGWANLFQDAFYANVNGSILRVNNLGIPEDYRDGSEAIELVLESRATDFGQAGIRKVVSFVILNYRTGGVSENTTVSTAPDLFKTYDETTPFTVVNIPPDDGLSSFSGQDVTTIRHSLPKRRCIYLTVRIENNGINEDLEIAGMSYVVAGLNSKGITQAANTKQQNGI